MREFCRDLNLAQEPNRAECGAHLRSEHLDHDGSRVLPIRCAVHHRAASARQLALQVDASFGEPGPDALHPSLRFAVIA